MTTAADQPALEWFGCSTFRLTVDGSVIFLDAYLERVASADPSGLQADDVTRADWILVGHSHFDHLYGADTIARNTGATIVGSYETARVMASLGVPEAQLLRVAGGERVRLGDDIHVRVLPALHSSVWTHRQAPEIDEECVGSLGVPHQAQLAAMRDLVQWVGTLGEEVLGHLQSTASNAHGDGGTLSYLIETPAGSVLFQDSAGCWPQLLAAVAPDVAILAAGGRPNDGGEPWQGSLIGFLARELDLLDPRTVVLCHHDDFLPGFSRPVDVDAIERALGASHPATSLLRLEKGRSYRLLDPEQI